ncbi:hypothetical protein CDAR_594541 [Caerostris darwini]|uniref:Uncharacterized protein n=1 Tax=Caerostris darwini TaxID=1538125 RepID=A0AAV4WU32_9ARAC|nr:hypothetical protein CDAR_594541 [Caerostris darwini]
MSVNYFFRLNEFQTHLFDLFAVTLFRTPRGQKVTGARRESFVRANGKRKGQLEEKLSLRVERELSLSLSGLQREAADNIYRSTGKQCYLERCYLLFHSFFNAFCGNRLLER